MKKRRRVPVYLLLDPISLPPPPRLSDIGNIDTALRNVYRQTLQPFNTIIHLPSVIPRRETRPRMR